MATTYEELKAEIQRWADNDNPNFVASIPDLIADTELLAGRELHTRDMECITTTPLAPDGVLEADLGVYALPDDWSGHKGVYAAEDTLTIHYWTKVPALSATVETNWLLAKHPDLYRYGSLMSAEAFLKNDPRIAVWAAKTGEILKAIERRDKFELYGGGPLRSRDEGARPWADGENPGRLDYLPPFDFLDIVANEVQSTACGYFTVTQSEIRIWPKPEMPDV